MFIVIHSLCHGHLVNLSSSCLTVSHQLKMNNSNSVASVVVDVLGPGPALDMKKLALVDIVKLDSHQGGLVVLLVQVGEVLGGEGSILGEVLKAFDTFFISRILSLAGNPDFSLIFCRDNFVLQFLWQ